MNSRSVLVRIPGYPFHPAALQPDRRLAEAAAYLFGAGHDTQVRDFGTVGLVACMFPDEWRDQARQLVRRFLDERSRNPLVTLHTLWRVRSLDRVFCARRIQVAVRLADELAAESAPDFLCLSLSNPDDMESAEPFIRRYRQIRPRARIAALGVLVDAYGDSLARIPGLFDCLFTAGGEASLPAWAEHLGVPREWAGLPNLIYNDNGAIRRTRYQAPDTAGPFPAYGAAIYPSLHGNEDLAALKLRLFEIEESRGCPRRCYACVHDASEDGLHAKPASRIAAEIRTLSALHGARAFHMLPSALGSAQAGDAAASMLRQGLDAVYSRAAHVCYASPAALPLVRASGCAVASFQVDTGSQRLQEDLYGRSITVTRIEELLRRSVAEGIYTIVHLTFPSPADDEHTQEETLRLLARTRPHAATVALPQLSPHSAWRKEAQSFGFGVLLAAGGPSWSGMRTRFPLPYDRWRPASYRIGGLSAGQALQAQEDLLERIGKLGIQTTVSEGIALMAHMVGYEEDMGAFSQRVLHALFTGEIEALAGLVQGFNAAATTPVSASDPKTAA